MEGRGRHLADTARNPQRRLVLTLCGRPARADEGNDDGSGAVFRHYHFRRYRRQEFLRVRRVTTTGIGERAIASWTVLSKRNAATRDRHPSPTRRASQLPRPP